MAARYRIAKARSAAIEVRWDAWRVRTGARASSTWRLNGETSDPGTGLVREPPWGGGWVRAAVVEEWWATMAVVVGLSWEE